MSSAFALSLFTERHNVLAQPYADVIIISVQGSCSARIRHKSIIRSLSLHKAKCMNKLRIGSLPAVPTNMYGRAPRTFRGADYDLSLDPWDPGCDLGMDMKVTILSRLDLESMMRSRSTRARALYKLESVHSAGRNLNHCTPLDHIRCPKQHAHMIHRGGSRPANNLIHVRR